MMRKILLFSCWCLFSLCGSSQCVTNVDFSTWTQGGQPGNGNWQVQSGGSQVYQSVNGAPTFFYSPFNLMNVHISGNFKTTDTDDDYLGFVFSFLNPLTATDSFDCWLFDWKQVQQGSAPAGMSLDRCNGYLPSSTYTPQFWNHTNNAQFTCVANNFGSAGWITNYNHAFDLYLTYTEAKIYVDGVLKFDWLDCYKVGRFGFYNLSQGDCYYSNFQYSLYIDFTLPTQACIGTPASFVFIPPCVGATPLQYQNITWDFGDGTVVTVNNPTPATANVNHTYITDGSYTVKISVTDNNGCTASQSHTIDIAGPIKIDSTLADPKCNGGSDGSISVLASNGFGNYIYNWNTGNYGPSYPGITAGTYSVTVTDGLCNSSAQYTLNQPTALTATTSHTDASCGASTGSATIAISGGTPPYTGVNWSGTPGYTVGSLPAGTYIADFHDANGCSSLNQYQEIIGSTPCGITANTTVVDINCFGDSTGQATLNVVGTTGAAVITWSNGGSGATITGLIAGTYTYNYSDADPLHAFTGSVTVHQSGAAMVAQLSTVGIVCAGVPGGQAVASVISGGVAPYHYAWSVNSHDTPIDTGLSPGPVTVTVSDANGCSATATGTISGVPSLSTSFVTVMDSCYHSRKGSSIVSVAGGTPPYTYTWSNFYSDSANLHLIAGTYTLTVSDSRNCSVTGSAVVNGPAATLLSPWVRQDEPCYGNTVGSFKITVTGGTPGYNYVWNPSTVSGSNPTGLAAGIYNYTVTDANNCTAIGGDTIVQPAAALSATTSHIDVSCHGGSDGALIVTIGGGTPPYKYQGFTIPAGTDTLPGLAANTYAGVITDSNSCTVNISETINEPGVQSLTLDSTDVTCYGDSTGTITANFVNATGSVTYNWNPGGVQTAVRTGLVATTYAVTATDSKNCTVSNTTKVNQPTAIAIQPLIVDVDCYGANTGGISVTVTGGTGATYTYAWNPNLSTTNSVALVPAGAYTVSVTDSANCVKDTTLNVAQPLAPLSDTKLVNDISCFGAHDGNITITPTGGTSGYTYAWTPNVSATNTATGLGAGIYSVTITDSKNCTATDDTTIIEPALLALTQSQTDLVCYHVSTGLATVAVTGGTIPYAYSWAPNVSAADSAINIAAGVYGVTVTDNHSCTISTNFTLTEPAQLVVQMNHTDELCFGDKTAQITLIANGGTGAYTYTWNPNVGAGNTVTGLGGGNYTYIVSDSNACSVTQTVTVLEPAQISLVPQVTNLTCYNDNKGAITVTESGGTSPFAYSLESGGAVVQTSANPQFTGLAAGAYFVKVADANLCTDSVPAVIASPSQLLNSVDSSNVTCYGFSNGKLNANPSGGTPGYTFALSNGATNNTGIFTGLNAGTYTVTVTDAGNCTTTQSINITQPDSFIIAVTPVQSTVKLGDTLQLNATSNQPDSVQYSWDPITGLSCFDCANPVFNNVYSTVYNITGTSSNGCNALYSVSVTVIPNYNVFVPNVFSPNGDGNNDVWKILGDLYTVKLFAVKVFNRLGEKVYESGDINAGWDGTYKGEKAPAGVYVYELSFVWLDNHSDDHYKGTLTLLR